MIVVSYTWHGYEVVVLVESSTDISTATRKIKASIRKQYPEAQFYEDSFNAHRLDIGEATWI